MTLISSIAVLAISVPFFFVRAAPIVILSGFNLLKDYELFI